MFTIIFNTSDFIVRNYASQCVLTDWQPAQTLCATYRGYVSIFDFVNIVSKNIHDAKCFFFQYNRCPKRICISRTDRQHCLGRRKWLFVYENRSPLHALLHDDNILTATPLCATLCVCHFCL